MKYPHDLAKNCQNGEESMFIELSHKLCLGIIRNALKPGGECFALPPSHRLSALSGIARRFQQVIKLSFC